MAVSNLLKLKFVKFVPKSYQIGLWSRLGFEVRRKRAGVGRRRGRTGTWRGRCLMSDVLALHFDYLACQLDSGLL